MFLRHCPIGKGRVKGKVVRIVFQNDDIAGKVMFQGFMQIRVICRKEAVQVIKVAVLGKGIEGFLVHEDDIHQLPLNGGEDFHAGGIGILMPST